jgi:hypothetical protein
MAHDVPRYGLTTEMAQKMSFVGLTARIKQLAVQDVIHNFVRKIVLFASDVTVAQQDRMVAGIQRSGPLMISFLIAYHPFSWFGPIGDAEKDVTKKAIEMLRLFENVWKGIFTLPAGDSFEKSFEVVARNAGVFVRFFQDYLDAYKKSVSMQTKCLIKDYRTIMNTIYRMKLDTLDENSSSFKLLEKKEEENKCKFKKVLGIVAIKIIEEHRAAFFKNYDAAKLLNAPSRCASGFDGEASRRLH